MRILRQRVAVLTLVAVLIATGAAIGVSQAMDRGGDAYVGPGNPREVVPIGTIVLPDGTVIIQEGVLEWEEETPSPSE